MTTETNPKTPDPELAPGQTLAVGVYRHEHGTDVAFYRTREEAVLGLLAVVLVSINSGEADEQLSLDSQKEILQAYREGDYDGALESYNRDSEDEEMYVRVGIAGAPTVAASADYLEQIERVLEQKQKDEDDEYEAAAGRDRG